MLREYRTCPKTAERPCDATAAILDRRTAPVRRSSRSSSPTRSSLPVVLLVVGLVAYPLFYAIYISFTTWSSAAAGEWIGLDNFRYLAGRRASPARSGTRSPSWLSATRSSSSSGSVSHCSSTSVSRPRAFPLFHDAAVGDARFRRLPDLARALPADRRRHQSRSHRAGNLPRGHRLARPEIDRDAGGHHRLRVAGLPVLVHRILAALQSSTAELYEAARVDGANAWRGFGRSRFRHRRVVIVTTLLSSIWTANSFENVWLLTQGGPSDATMVFPVLAYFGMQTLRLGEAAAVSVAMVPVLAILVFVTSR